MLKRILPLAACLMFLIGCRTELLTPAGQLPAPPATAELSVMLSGPPKGSRRVLVTPAYRSTDIQVEVTGAGYGATRWLPVTPADGTDGVFYHEITEGNGQNVTVAKVAGVVPAGSRRIFRVHVYDSKAEPHLRTPSQPFGGSATSTPEPFKHFQVEEIWGVADMIPGQTNPVTVTPYTTATAKVFQRLIQIDEAKALTVPILHVQGLINTLLNTHHLTGKALNAAMPQESYALLDAERVALAIVRGNAGTPFQVPEPVPEDLLLRDPVVPTRHFLNPLARSHGKVRLKVLDLHGDVLSGRPFMALVSDPASPTRLLAPTASAEVTFDEVAPGTWMVEHTDLERGGKVGKLVNVVPGQTAEAYTVAYPSTEIVAGSFDADQDLAGSFNDEDVPMRLAFLGSAGRFSINNGLVTYTDGFSHRVRRFSLTDGRHLVKTIAGNGLYGTRGDDGPGRKARIQVNGDSDVVTDKHGVTYFYQDNFQVRALTPGGIMKTVWAFPEVGTAKAPTTVGRLGYDAASHSLYAWALASGCDASGCSDTYYSYQLSLNGAPEAPAVVSQAATAFDRAHGFAAGFSVHLWTGGSSRSVNRVSLATGQLHQLVAGDGDRTKPIGDDTGHFNYQAPGVRGVAADHNGNLFIAGDLGLYRVMRGADPGATSSDFRTKLLLRDAAIRDVAFDSATRQLYILTRQAYVTPSGTKQVPVIKRVVR